MTPDDRTVSGGPTLADEGAEAAAGFRASWGKISCR